MQHTLPSGSPSVHPDTGPEPSEADRQWLAGLNAEAPYTLFDCSLDGVDDEEPAERWYDSLPVELDDERAVDRYLDARARATRIDAEEEARLLGWIR